MKVATPAEAFSAPVPDNPKATALADRETAIETELV